MKTITTISVPAFILGVVNLLIISLTFSDTALATDVVIIDDNKNKTQVSDFTTHRSDSCGHIGFYYRNVPRETNFYWDFVPIFTFFYEVRIPLHIIRQITKSEGKSYDIILADNTKVHGKLSHVTNFIGESDLGKLYIKPDDIEEIKFLNEPKVNFNASPKGDKTAKLITFGDNQVLLEGVIFVKEKRNENGCYIGEEYKNNMAFKSGAAEYELSWEKISAFIFMDASLKLISKKGNEHAGKALDIKGVEAVAQIGNYKLAVTVPFSYTRSKKILFD